MSKRPIAFLPGAKHSEVHLENSRINVAENIINNQLAGPYGSELQQLMHYCLLGALVDSEEQYDAPQCEPETREAIILQVDDWGRNRDGKSAPLMWLRGGAGAGKSTLAQTIAMMYKREGILVGSFFFSNRRTNRRNGSAMILTLVLQLLVMFPAVAPFVFEVIKKNPMILTSSPEEHMRQLFVDPLNAMNAIEPNPLLPYLLQLFIVVMFILQSLLGPIVGDLPYGHHIFLTPSMSKLQPCLIVIDGLDECDDEAVQCRLLRIIATAIPRLSRPLRFLIASRPEARITWTFEQDSTLSSLPVQQLDLSADRDADADIHRYLRRRFATLRQSHPFGENLPKNWPSHQDILVLVGRSSRHFIYPSTVMTFIEDPTDFPHHLLKAILDPSKRTSTSDPLSPLNELYLLIFSRVKERDLPVIQLFFGLMYFENLHDGTFSWQYLSLSQEGSNRQKMDSILQLEKGHLDIIMQPLRSLLRLPTYHSNEHDIRYRLQDAPSDVNSQESYLFQDISSNNPEDKHPTHGDLSTSNPVGAPDHLNRDFLRSPPGTYDRENFRIFHATLFDFLLDHARSNDYHVDLGWVHEKIAKHYISHLLEGHLSMHGLQDDRFLKFSSFISHCKMATISDCFIPSYLQTCDFLYVTFIPSNSEIDIKHSEHATYMFTLLETILIFLNLVCKKDIDSTGRFRLGHLRLIEQTLSAKFQTEYAPESTENYHIYESGKPAFNTNQLLQHLETLDIASVQDAKSVFSQVCSALAQWRPNEIPLIRRIHPDREAVVQNEKKIIAHFLKLRKAWTTWRIECGPLLHLVYWSIPREDVGDLLHTLCIFTYDPWGRSFQSIAMYYSEFISSPFDLWIKHVARFHLERCERLLNMGEDAPWSSYEDFWRWRAHEFRSAPDSESAL